MKKGLAKPLKMFNSRKRHSSTSVLNLSTNFLCLWMSNSYSTKDSVEQRLAKARKHMLDKITPIKVKSSRRV